MGQVKQRALCLASVAVADELDRLGFGWSRCGQHGRRCAWWILRHPLIPGQGVRITSMAELIEEVEHLGCDAEGLVE